MKYKELRKNLKKDMTGLPAVKIAVAADSAVQYYSEMLRAVGYDLGLNIDVYEGAFDQLEAELLAPGSELYAFEPEYVILFPSAQAYRDKLYNSPVDERADFAVNEAERIRSLSAAVSAHSKARCILLNYEGLDDGVYGNYAATYDGSLRSNIIRSNLLTEELCGNDSNTYLLDVEKLVSYHGSKNTFDGRIYYLASAVFDFDFYALLAKSTLDILTTLRGKLNKCIVLDLDNTLWGGVVGDDGLSGIKLGGSGAGKAFKELQMWLKELSQRGIALAVCSKNDEHIAKEVFEKHPDMILRLEDIAVFVANWDDKAQNIKNIRDVLNIGFDSMVFIDDNPFERELVKRLIPDVTVPEIPEDPVKVLSYLQEMNLFESAGVSREDRERGKMYKAEGKRESVKQNAAGIEDYLRSLDMNAAVTPFNEYSVPRVAQLTQRSNQFNLRTVRYTESEIADISRADEFTAFSVSLSDVFGDSGIIAVIIMKEEDKSTLFIDTLIMSCRVLKRGVEEFIMNKITEIAKENGFRHIRGEYLPTAKNSMVKNLYPDFGYQESNGSWILDVNGYKARDTFVKEKKQ